MSFQIRTSCPYDNKYYIRQVNGGWNGAIQGNPTKSGANVLANCVGYANGRFAEIMNKGYIPYQLVSNAENFIEHARDYGLEISDKPTLGGIMVWRKGATLSGNDGAGHVAIVEKIIDSNTIYTSESAWNGTAFFNSTRSNSNGRWGMGSAYTFRGCIVNPEVKDEPQPEPTPTPTDLKIGDEVIINGDLYTNSNADKPAGHVSNKRTYITRIALGSKHPYNTTGDLGWMDRSSITKISGDVPQPTLTIGTRVKTIATGNGASDGSSVSAMRGLTGTITRIINGAKYPYLISDNDGPLGWYQADALQII